MRSCCSSYSPLHSAQVPILTGGGFEALGGYAFLLLMWSPGCAGIVTSLVVYRSLTPLGLASKRRTLSWVAACIAFPIVYSLLIKGGLAATGMISLGGGDLPIAFLVFTGLFLSLRNALGEELGWRGFATPVVTRVFGFWPGQTAGNFLVPVSCASAAWHVLRQQPASLVWEFRVLCQLHGAELFSRLGAAAKRQCVAKCAVSRQPQFVLPAFVRPGRGEKCLGQLPHWRTGATLRRRTGGAGDLHTVALAASKTMIIHSTTAQNAGLVSLRTNKISATSAST